MDGAVVQNGTAAAASRPNIVLVLTDDQDYVLGGLKPLRQATALIAGKGALASNWFAHTPVCCPSRAQFLTGRYFHNLRMPGPSGGCMHVQTGVPGVEDKVNDHSFAKHLVRDGGYTAAWFGKHLNTCPKEPPPGFDCPTCRWFTNGGGQDTEPGGFISANFNDFHGTEPSNGTYSRNGTYWSWLPGAPVIGGLKAPQFGGYTTSIIANKSIEWIRQVGGAHARRDARGALATPFLLVLAPKAPHYAATPAPWYEHGTWVDRMSAPRTASYGVPPEALRGHHRQIANQGPLTSGERLSVDRHFRKRWKSLLSVDDAIAGVVQAVEELQLIDSTYFFVTSDHGYNLGQHNLPSCKLQVYDHAIRVPMMVRGPGIPAGSSFTQLASHVDLAPTLVALGGLDPRGVAGPPMDGVNLLPWLLTSPSPAALPRVRDALLVEFYSLGNLTVCGGGTCAGDREDPYGYCHMPCFNFTCDPHVCANATCCGAPHTQFSSLEGMRCGAGHAPGSLPYNTSHDPGHQCDSDESNTFRALRFVGPNHGNRLYAEFTRVSDWNFSAADVFVEVFDLDDDPGQLVNLASVTPKEELRQYHETIRKQFVCAGVGCT